MKKILKEIIAPFAIMPGFIALAALISRLFSSDLLVVFITTSAAFLITVAIFLYVGPADNRSNIGFQRIGILLTSDVFLSVTFFCSWHLVININPWNNIGWLIVGCVFVSSVILWFLHYLHTRSVRNYNDAEIVSRLLQFINVLGFLIVIYLVMGTQWVWIPLVLYSMLDFYFISRKEDYLDNVHPWKRDLAELKYTLFISTSIGLLSSIMEFWETPILFGYKTPYIALTLIALIVTIIVGRAIYFFIRDKVEQKNKERKWAKRQEEIRLGAEKEKEEWKKQEAENEAKEAEQKEKNKKKGVEAKNRVVEEKEQAHWFDIGWAYHWGGLSFDLFSEIVPKKKLIDLFKVSEVKKQIVFNEDELTSALSLIGDIFRSCFNDEILKELIKQVKELEQFSEYTGYNALYKLIKKAQSESAAFGKLVEIKEVKKLLTQ